MQTLPEGTDIDLCYVTPPGGTRTHINLLVNTGTNTNTVSSGGALTFAAGSTLNVQGAFAEAVSNAVTAGATAGQSHAVAMPPGYAVISSVPVTLGPVSLPPVGQIGQSCFVINNGASPCAVFPNETTSTIIDALATATAVTLTNANGCLFVQNSATSWVSTGKAGHSA